jgi:NhaP-type Na+/H+ or K+/H+ antiporter
MRRIFERNCESERDWHSSWSLMSVLVVLLVCNGTKALLRYFQLHWIPDACAFILCGSFLGGMLSLFNITKKLSFDNDLFMSILLPPILHHASLTIDKNAFKRNLFSILSLAFFGTAFCAFSIGWVVHHMSKLGAGKSLPLIDSLVFGSLISSIDPVATLGILSSVGVSRSDTLYILIFGESLLNDGGTSSSIECLIFASMKPC